MSADSEGARRDHWLGVALLILGGMLVVVKVVGWGAIQMVLRLWPLALIFIGWQMYRRAGERSGEPPPED